VIKTNVVKLDEKTKEELIKTALGGGGNTLSPLASSIISFFGPISGGASKREVIIKKLKEIEYFCLECKNNFCK
jgi:hypothetical protein